MRFLFIQAHARIYRVRTMCRVLEVSRAGYYAWRARPLAERSLVSAGLSKHRLIDFLTAWASREIVVKPVPKSSKADGSMPLRREARRASSAQTLASPEKSHHRLEAEVTINR